MDLDPGGMAPEKGAWFLLSTASYGANRKMSRSLSFKNNIPSVNQGGIFIKEMIYSHFHLKIEEHGNLVHLGGKTTICMHVMPKGNHTGASSEFVDSNLTIHTVSTVLSKSEKCCLNFCLGQQGK